MSRLSRFVRVEFCWSSMGDGMAKLKIAQKERLIEF